MKRWAITSITHHGRHMKIKKAWYLGADYEMKRLFELEGKELSLKAMYPIIGCTTVEHVGLGKGVDMWVDEEGLLKGYPVQNMRATEKYRAAYPQIAREHLAIFGNAIITDNTKAGDYIAG